MGGGGGKQKSSPSPKNVNRIGEQKGGTLEAPHPPSLSFHLLLLGLNWSTVRGGLVAFVCPHMDLPPPPKHWAQCWDPSACRYWGGPTAPPPHTHPQPPLRCWGGGHRAFAKLCPLPTGAADTGWGGGGTPSAATSPPQPRALPSLADGGERGSPLRWGEQCQEVVTPPPQL